MRLYLKFRSTNTEDISNGTLFVKALNVIRLIDWGT